MTDHSHLDELVATTTDHLSLRLLRTFQAAVRDPNLNAADYVSKMKMVLEENVQCETDNAAAGTVDK